jgi:O-antigen/teichoic acid export membrane protein
MTSEDQISDSFYKIAEDSARSSFFLITGSIVSTIISAVSTILIGRFLGAELYGQYALAIVVPQLLFLFADIGINQGVIKFSASLKSKGEMSQFIPLIKHGLIFKAIIGIMISIASFAFAGHLATYLVNRPEIEPYIRIASISILFQVATTTATSAFVGLDKTQYNALTTNLQAVAKATVSLALVLLGLSVAGAITGFVVGYVISGAVGIAILFTMLHEHSGIEEQTRFAQNLKTLMEYGIPLYISILLTGFVLPYQSLILAQFTTDVDIGNFKAATNFVTLITVLSLPITTALLPAFSKLDSTNQRKIGDFFKLANKYTTLAIVPTTIIVIAFSKEIVLLLYGSTFQSASLFLSIYGLLYLLVGMGYLTINSFLNGLGETRIFLNMTLVNFLIFLTLTPLFTQKLGVPGLIIAFLISNIAGTIYGFYITRTKFGIGYAKKPITKIYVSAIASALPALLMLRFSPLPQFISIVAGGTIYLIAYATLIPVLETITFDELETASHILGRIRLLSKLSKPLLDYEKKILNYVSTRGNTDKESTPA